jgi:uncharacterized damage-inducible protein DinB
MDFAQLFQQRHDVLYDFFLADFWKTVPDDLLRQRPHPSVNSIAWVLWHMARVEDSGMNLFVTERSQILDEGGWMKRMNIPWRHNGGGMVFEEVDDLNQRIDLAALHDYSRGVQQRSREIIEQISQTDLDATMQPERLRVILLDEGLAHSDPEGLVKWYSGWSKGKCLMTFGLTHPFQHIGEMGVIASLLGIVFE